MNQGKPILKLVSPIPVSVNHYMKPRSFIIYKGGKPVSQVTMYETAEAKDYKKKFIQEVINEVKKQKWELTPNATQHFYVDSFFYFPRIDMDANNYYKIMLDSITEPQTIWIDDNVACERVQGIWYDSDNPRIELIIYPVDYIGIFTNKEHLIEFQDTHCSKCSKYTKNCSVLKKAIEGRIQEEIDGKICTKYKAKKGL